ncbi:MAG: hypothetical protein EOO91_12740 [Pedobacter sp.]|nr:MAG: hypothetical protein EOO91_12740 [Pedobacter sp.]
MNFLKKLFGQTEPDENYEPKITVEKIQQLFEYGKRENLIGTGDDNLIGKYKVGHQIRWETESKFRKAYNDIPAQTVPPHIQWGNNPVFGYVSILDNKVQYHYAEDGGSAVFICPITTNTEHIKFIDEIFEHYYNKFGLPNVLNQIKITKEKANKTDKMKFLEEYLKTQDQEFFNDNLCDDEDIYEIAMWIDWREEDENIINYCEDILQTEQLSVETLDAENERGFDTIITYNNQEISIPYKGNGADRDTTIKTLNLSIQSEFEIRLCKESLGSDTLCFVPLTNKQWNELDKNYPKQVNEKFEKITTETKMFG